MNTSIPKLNATSSQTRILPLLLFFLLVQLMGNAQTFVGSIINTAGNSAIPSTGTGGCTVVPQTTGGTIFNCTVAGLTNQVPASCLLNFTHTFDSDIDMFLKAPNGQILELSTDNGGGGDNFTNTNFVTGAPNITTGTPPYTGNFAPEGTLTAEVCSGTITPTVTALGNFTAAQNGIWQLVIQDDAGGDVGVMLNWSITFAVSVPPCILTAPANITVNASPGLCAANASVNLPSASPQGCIDGINTGIRYSVNGGTFTNVVLPATMVTINNLPVGTNTITWQTYLISNGVTVSTVTQTIVVVDNQAPTITCPANIVTTLGSGECYAFINYNVTATDNCPFAGPATQSQTHGSTGTVQNNFATITFGLRNDGTTPILITGVYCNLGDFPGPAFNGVVQTRLLYGPIGGPGSTTGTADITAWTPTPTQAISVNVTQYFQTTLFQIPLANQFVLNPGQARGIAVQATNGNFMRYSNGNQTTTDGHVGIISNGHYAGGAVNVLGNTPRMFKGAVRYSEFLSQIPIVQTAGLPSGAAFPIGTTTNCFTATDYAGFTASCCFNVVVHEFPNPSFELACNDNVQVSLDQECSAIVTADMILEGGSYGCYDNYIVQLDKTAPYGDGPWVPGILGPNDAGHTYTVRITDPNTGNTCWGTITVEDKIPPVIQCRDVTIMCGEQLPDNPAPAISGYQTLIITGLNDIVELNSFTYDFNYSYLPANTPALDVDVRIKLLDHTWLPDLNIVVQNPAGTNQSVFQVTGCFGQEWPMDCWFDDEGAVITQCVDLNCNGCHLQPLQLPGVSTPVLNVFDNTNASGTWHITISDNAAGDDGTIKEVGLAILVDLPQEDPFDNCGPVTTTFTDTQTGDPCEGITVVRHWVATDQSGNTAACDQNITVQPLVLDSVVCPPAYIGHCGDNSDPEFTGWPTVNGIPITDENNVCNIFVGYWDKPINDCGNGEKIVRTWTILNWCNQTTKKCNQVIKLSDGQAPEITCPGDFTVGTDFWYCYSSVSVPKPDVVDACGSAYTLSLASDAGTVVNYGNNYVINQLPLGTHTVTWTATDECNNSASCTFTITVIDDVPPVANCDQHTVVALTNDGPSGITLVPAEVFNDGSYDNCGPVTFRARRMDSCIDYDWTTEGACIDDVPGGIPPVNSRDRGTVHRPCVPFACCDVGAGPIMIELEVTDEAGNRNYCMIEAIVQDKISPFVECPPDITVSCDFWFNAQEGTFVDGEGNNNGNLDEDPLSPIFGNMFDAFRYNDDQSVRQDIIINDPHSDIQPQPHFWGIDGWADDNCQVSLQVRVRIVDDCSGGTLPGNAPEGAVKLIERRFSASDGNDGVAPGTCTQRIWVVDYDPFYITDTNCNNPNPNDGVIWPCDVLFTNCPEDLGDTGEPTLFDDACSLVAATYEDERFDFVDGACFKILRHWKVIDWCQYNAQTGYGLWEYIQVIKVHDQTGPEFTDCPAGPVTLCVADQGVSLPDNNQAFLGHEDPNSSSCSVHLNLHQIVHETCSDLVNFDVKLYPFNGDEYWVMKPTTTVAVDENNNADLSFDTRQNSIQSIRLNGIPYNSPFCGDYHRLLWTAEDGCGNITTCEYLIRLEDCKLPSPVCINGLSTVVMPVGGQVTIWAKDFNASSFDDCAAEADLLYSFSGDTYQPSYTYTCDNVPAFGVELAVDIWVADEGTDDNCNGQISWNERNKDYCTTTIVITDNAHVCGDTTGPIVHGEVLTDNLNPVELVSVNLNSPGHVFPTYVTSHDGHYYFDNIIFPADYAVSAERNDNPRNGVSTLDLVKIQKHLLGIEPFSNPFNLIAADANNSQSVSAIDMVELRKLILGIYSKLPNSPSWRFVDKNYQFGDPANPWPFDEVIDINQPDSSSKDFVGIKVGDVNNSVQANALQILPRNGNGIVHFTADEQTVAAGEKVDVAIRSKDFSAIEGYQFTMTTLGLEFAGVESGVLTMNDENLGVFRDMLTASWHKVGGVTASADDVLFTLHFKATTGGQLSDMLDLNSKETQAEAYTSLDVIKDLKLNFRGAQQDAEFALYQNEPNPFRQTTAIGYEVPVPGKVTLTVFDITGKVLFVKDQDAIKGYNTITVSTKELAALGLLYYRLDASEYSATKKMIILE